MQCPECHVELNQIDEYGYFCAHQSGEKLGDIFQCPNINGFESEKTARKYNPEFEGDWREILCESTVHNGHFYTDKSGNLKEGYPC